MPLNKLPLLPESYPLFDWADWQSSRNALVSGTPTKNFAKEAWNAIIDSLADAFTAAGLEWDTAYTSSTNAKITQAYGELSAAKFNSIRYNIEWPAPIKWAWATQEDFRGYLGRTEVRGRVNYGGRCDSVYPEYILELARRLNLLLELMRGTASIGDGEALMLSRNLIDLDLRVRPAVHGIVNQASGTNKSPGMRVQPGARVHANLRSLTTRTVQAITKAAMVTSTDVPMSSQLSAAGRSREKLILEPQGLLMPALVYAQMEHNRMAELSGFYLDIQTKCSIEALVRLCLQTESQLLMPVDTAASMIQKLPLPTDGKVLIPALETAEATKSRVKEMRPTVKSSTVTSIKFYMPQLHYLEVAHNSTIRNKSVLDTGWLPPVWLNDGLYIRQVHNTPVQRDDGSLEVT